MSSSNFRRNKAFIEKFRKELESMMDDITEIDEKVLTEAVRDVGVKFAKDNTPVSKGGNVVEFVTKYPKEVEFTTKDGKHVKFTVKAGKHVKFTTKTSRVGGSMRRSWRSTRTIKKAGEVTKTIINNVDYAPYVNYGHVIRNKKDGPIKGFVKGQFMLEKAINEVEKQLIKEFGKEVERVNKKHDK